MGYEWNPIDYERSSSAQAKWAEEFVAQIEFHGDESVLDIGCGDGKVTALLAEKVPGGSVLGVDTSRSMLDLATTRHEHHAPHLRFEMADASKLPYNEDFDIVFSNSTLHWIPDHRPVLEGIRRSLKPGGRAYLRFGGKGATAEVGAVLRNLMRQQEWSAYFEGFAFPFGFFDAAEYIPWLRSAGLRAESVELVPRTMLHDIDGFAAWVRTTKMPYTERVPAAQRERFLHKVVADYIERFPPNPQGQIAVTMTRLDVIATRPLE